MLDHESEALVLCAPTGERHSVPDDSFEPDWQTGVKHGFILTLPPLQYLQPLEGQEPIVPFFEHDRPTVVVALSGVRSRVGDAFHDCATRHFAAFAR